MNVPAVRARLIALRRDQQAAERGHVLMEQAETAARACGVRRG